MKRLMGLILVICAAMPGMAPAAPPEPVASPSTMFAAAIAARAKVDYETWKFAAGRLKASSPKLDCTKAPADQKGVNDCRMQATESVAERLYNQDMSQFNSMPANVKAAVDPFRKRG